MRPPATRRPPSPWQRLRAWLGVADRPAAAALSDEAQACALIRAIDAGGLPLNPARVNDIARRLGLEVSRHAPMDETIQRVRVALARRGLRP